MVRVLPRLHTKDARALGETEQRLFVSGRVEEAAFYSSANARARAYRGRHPDHGRPRARRGLRARRAHFNEQELIGLVLPDHHQRLEPPCYHDAY